ncbi:MAG: hypothetical protein BroJett009_00130 [Armatimonadota bacterium]|nr:MAG: hypothetical protein BroJett009_00130 [Armatimonadota bacterium]
MGVKAKRALIAHFRKDFDEAGRSERGRVLYTLFQTTGRVRKHAMHARTPPPTRFGCSGADGYPMGKGHFLRVPPQTRFGVLWRLYGGRSHWGARGTLPARLYGCHPKLVLGCSGETRALPLRRS